MLQVVFTITEETDILKFVILKDNEVLRYGNIELSGSDPQPNGCVHHGGLYSKPIDEFDIVSVSLYVQDGKHIKEAFSDWIKFRFKEETVSLIEI